MSQYQKEYAAQFIQALFINRMIQDQLDAMHKGYGSMNYYLLCNQTFITVHGSNVVKSFRLSIWFTIVNQVIMFLTVFNLDMFSRYIVTRLLNSDFDLEFGIKNASAKSNLK